MTQTTENFERLSETSLVSMSDEWFEYANMDHFWMLWRLNILRKIFKKIDLKGKSMLEIGCGNGIFKAQLEKEGYTIDGCDLNITALKYAEKGKGRLLLYNIFDKKIELMNKYDCIFLMDVIEHIDNEAFFVKTAMEHAVDKGYIVFNVPAHNYLFSKYDIEAGHLRRYNKKKIKELFKSCNISEIYIGYWGFLLIPIALLRKIYLIIFPKNIIKSGFKPPNRFFNFLFKILMYMELLLPFMRFTGTSLVAIGKINKSSPDNE